MAKKCCLCRNTVLKKGVSFHSFPNDKKLLKTWIDKINFTPSKNSRICSDHFLPTDYQENIKVKRLLKTAVPSVFPSTEQIYFNEDTTLSSFSVGEQIADSSSVTADENRSNLAPRNGLSPIHFEDEVGDDTTLSSFSVGEQNTPLASFSLEGLTTNKIAGNEENFVAYSSFVIAESDDENQSNLVPKNVFSPIQLEEKADPSSCTATLASFLKEMEQLKEEIATVKQERDYYKTELDNVDTVVTELQKTISDLRSCRTTHRKFSLQVVKENLETLKYYTGFDNLQLFEDFFAYVTKNGTISFSTKLSVEDQILLVLSKIRQGFDFMDLSFRFSVNKKTVSKIFDKYINVMYNRVGCLNLWPRRELIFKDMPQKFLQEYPNTIIIVDATELKIEVPSSPIVQSQNFSTYKPSNTLKALVGCSPGGAIMFTSQLFAGSMSDDRLVTESVFYDCLVNKLNEGEVLKGDSVMVGKRFNVKEEIEALGLSINIPHLSSNGQFLGEEVVETRGIAPCRLYIERAIHRVKCYKILKGVLPINLLPLANQIWTVCCFLANWRQALAAR